MEKRKTPTIENRTVPEGTGPSTDNVPSHEKALMALLLALRGMFAPHLSAGSNGFTPPNIKTTVSSPIPLNIIQPPNGEQSITTTNAAPTQQAQRKTPRENHAHPTRWTRPM